MLAFSTQKPNLSTCQGSQAPETCFGEHCPTIVPRGAEQPEENLNRCTFKMKPKGDDGLFQSSMPIFYPRIMMARLLFKGYGRTVVPNSCASQRVPNSLCHISSPSPRAESGVGRTNLQGGFRAEASKAKADRHEIHLGLSAKWSTPKRAPH